MASRQDNVSSRNQQGNARTADSILTTSGDILYRNNLNQTRRLGIGEEDFQLTVSNGEAQWRRSTGELFKIGYASRPVGNWWNGTYGESGVPFNQSSLTKYNHANKIYANLKTINASGVLANQSTSSQGGYTAGNLVLYKANCQELWCTIKTDVSNLTNILDNLGTTGAQAITDITDFCETDTIYGIDLELDDPASLSTTGATNLNTWFGDLKTSLNNASVSASLNITLPALSNATVAAGYNFDYSTFIDSVDTCTINCCCAMSDFGYGMGTCPVELLVGGSYNDIDMCITGVDEQGTTTFYEGGVLQKYATDTNSNDMDKLVIALPCDGWANDEAQSPYAFTTNLTKNKINFNSTYNTNTFDGKRDTSHELRWNDGTYTYTFSDGYAMRRKAEICRQWLKKWELDNPLKPKPLYEMIFRFMGGNNPSYYE